MTVLSPLAAAAAPAIDPPSSASRPATAPEAGPAFQAALRTAADAQLDEPSFRHQSSRSAQLKPEQAFESFVLRSFIEEMLPKENTAVFGGGTSGNIWRSMLAERIADEMAASGGVGIAETIARDAKAPSVD